MHENEYLLFQLYAPLAAWGDVAVGEVRPTNDRPSKSAVLGMVAAALGVRRDEHERLDALYNGYHFAVRLDLPGRLLRDYHTVQMPIGKRARGLPTRRDELNYSSLNTILSSRDYRCDAMAVVCLWPREGAPYSLDEVGRALRRPVFPLYLGRRACPPALPLNPQILVAGSLLEAFEQCPGDARLLRRLIPERRVQLFWDTSGNVKLSPERTTQRRDALVSRERWQYARRSEHVATVEHPGKFGE